MRAVAIVVTTHLAAVACGVAIGFAAANHAQSSRVAVALALGHSAEQLRNSLSHGSIVDARAAVEHHLELLNELKTEISEPAAALERLQARAALGYREELEGNTTEAAREFELAVALCRERGMTRCSQAELRATAERWLK